MLNKNLDIMSTLLQGLERKAQNDIRAFGGVGTIPSENFVSNDMRFPFLGIKDGPVTPENMASNTDRTLDVTFFIFYEINARSWLKSLFSMQNNVGLFELAGLVESTFVRSRISNSFSFLSVTGRGGSETLDILDRSGQISRTVQRLSITMRFCED